MKPSQIFRYIILATLGVSITWLANTSPVLALEKRANSEIVSLSPTPADGPWASYQLKTTGPVDLPKNPFILSSPNRIVFDFYGVLPGDQLQSSCRRSSSPQMAIRSGHHKNYTRIVLDFGENKIPKYRLFKKSGFITMQLASLTGHFPHSPPAKKDATQHIEKSTYDSPELVDSPDIDMAPDTADEFLLEDEPSLDGDKESTIGEVDDSLFDDEMGDPGIDEKTESAFRFSGSIENKYAYDTAEDNALESDALNHFQAMAKLNYNSDTFLSAQLGLLANSYTSENNGESDSDNEIRLHEAYVNLSMSSLNVKLGNQIVRWGKSDGYSPIDNVNPEDFRGGIAGRKEERKNPIPMANVEVDVRGTTIQALYIPDHYKSDFDIVGTDWSLFGPTDPTSSRVDYEEEEFDGPFGDPEFGIRIASTVHQFDFALSYLATRSDTPSIGSLSIPVGFPLDLENSSLRDLAAFAIATNQSIPILYEPQNIYGIEFETTWSDFGIRGDVAYFDAISLLNTDLDQIKKPQLQYVLGLDYISPSDFYINVQFSHLRILDYEETIAFQEEDVYSIHGTISQEFMDGELKLELRAFYDLSGDSTLYHPQILIKPWDNISIEIGAEIISGSNQTMFGLFEDNDQYYGTVKFEF